MIMRKRKKFRLYIPLFTLLFNGFFLQVKKMERQIVCLFMSDKLETMWKEVAA